MNVQGWGFLPIMIPDAFEGVPVTGIGEMAAHYFRSFPVDLRLPPTLRTIGSSAFSMCEFSRVVLPDSVEAIGSHGFASCPFLREIVLNNGLKHIGNSAFWRCKKLESVRIPASVEKIGKGAFAACLSLRSIEVDPANRKYETIGGWLVDKKTKQWLPFRRRHQLSCRSPKASGSRPMAPGSPDAIISFPSRFPPEPAASRQGLSNNAVHWNRSLSRMAWKASETKPFRSAPR
ncbi:MAG: leucine-rich repeat domain-containing protein [Kiritimatiellae bacterium]|nr:leucine-rich repeat domain-containing protein [Kiritimatiellia bacterium]